MFSHYICYKLTILCLCSYLITWTAFLSGLEPPSWLNFISFMFAWKCSVIHNFYSTVQWVTMFETMLYNTRRCSLILTDLLILTPNFFKIHHFVKPLHYIIIFNRPGVAEAVLQTPSWLIMSVGHPFVQISLKHHHSQIVWARAHWPMAVSRCMVECL